MENEITKRFKLMKKKTRMKKYKIGGSYIKQTEKW